MIDTLQPNYLAFGNLMSSQSGNIQELAAYSGHPSSFTIGSEPEPDSSPRQEFGHQHPPIPYEMGLRYMTIPAPDDVRFNPDSGTSHSPVYSVESITASSPSTIPFSSYSTFAPGLSTSPSYSNSNSSYLSTNPPNFCIADIKPTLSLFNNAALDMAPPSRSPHMQHLGSPVTARDLYASAAPQLRRASDLLSRSPPPSGPLRGVPLSPESSSGFASPANMENAQLNNRSEGPPPLEPTQNLFQLQTSDGQPVRPEILGKIDKGFFLAEGDWTCYRRNYFQLSCSYTLHPYLPSATFHLMQGGQSHQIYGFSMSIAAVVDGRDGRAIDLVQHTPKRDKGPQVRPDRVSLLPRSPPSIYGGVAGDGLGSRSIFDPNYAANAHQTPTEHTFERIQFKQATANNGKRRAAQQYYHILVELFADIGQQNGDGRWVKIAQRISAQMVVRGRSPGHYHAERRGSNTSTGPGGSTGQGGGSYGPSAGLGRAQGDQMSLSGSTPMLQGNYGGSYETRSHQYLSAPNNGQLDIPTEPIMSSEEVKTFRDFDGYLYYPSTINEPNIGSGFRSQLLPSYPYDRSRAQLPVSDYALSPKIKQEYHHTGISLPSMTAGPPDTFGTHCGRFEGFPSSRGYYPTTVFSHSEINSS